MYLRLENLITSEYDVKESNASLSQLNNSGIIRSNSRISNNNSPRFSQAHNKQEKRSSINAPSLIE
jgi:hypothetical protein